MTLAYIENRQCELVSRTGNTFRNFKDLALLIGENLRVGSAVIDSEIACVDDSGRSDVEIFTKRTKIRDSAQQACVLYLKSYEQHLAFRIATSFW